MIKLKEICSMFVEFMKKYTEFVTLEFRVKKVNDFEDDMLEVYRSFNEDGEYTSETKIFYYSHHGFLEETELRKNRYYLYITPKSLDLDKNEELKKNVKSLLDQFKQKGFQLKYSRYSFDCYYGILDRD